MKSILVALTAVYACSVNADVSGEQRPEVEYLMNFMKNSSCELNRNGKFYKGNEAVSHIKKKYEYFRNKITTTEEFIEYTATKSTISGKDYLVRCGDGETFKTKEWLLNELERYRENNYK